MQSSRVEEMKTWITFCRLTLKSFHVYNWLHQPLLNVQILTPYIFILLKKNNYVLLQVETEWLKRFGNFCQNTFSIISSLLMINFMDTQQLQVFALKTSCPKVIIFTICPLHFLTPLWIVLLCVLGYMRTHVESILNCLKRNVELSYIVVFTFDKKMTKE